MDALTTRVEAFGPDIRRAFGRRLAGVHRAVDAGRGPSRALQRIHSDLERLEAARTARSQLALECRYGDLPIAEARAHILKCIADHPVVILAGETGSGKTTQLPKMCLEAGRGIEGMIAHTQPRRVATRSVATRIAEELGTEVGSGVGSAVRFERRTSPSTRIKVMTDGVLLAETAKDRDLLAYDTIIVDEAHERSLNIDFLLGYLKRLQGRRADLKIIVTSATIDLDRFSQHFSGAPIIEIPGRTHPVEFRYRPLAVDQLEDDEAQAAAIVDAVKEIDRGGIGGDDPSGLPDTLVFLPGEREIRDVAQALEAAAFRETEVVPLYARLSNAQQDRVFHPGERRRIVLATNVAETSLTVPRIRAVIDTGLARISRYSPKSRVQRLPVEPISKASAAQRAGRCGRISPGVCIRLYGEEDFAERPDFTPPEILRSSLAAVVLRMAALGLGDPAAFPFVEPPTGRLLRDGFETLRELGAVDARDVITPLGRRLSDLPVDPRIGRMILAGVDEQCVSELLVVAAALTVPDPRDGGGVRSAAHLPFHDPRSDFLGHLKLWKAWRQASEEKGSSAIRTWCRRHELSHRRLREWQELENQLRDVVQRAVSPRVRDGEPQRRFAIPPLRDEVPTGAVHRAILAGLIAHVGRRQEDGSYRGVGGGSFSIFPGSVLHRERPDWIVCAEIVETSKRWGRCCARIRPDWIERVAPHLVRRTHFEPHYVPDTGFVCAYERVSCGDLDPTERRRVPYAPIDPEAARQVFIQEALVGERIANEPRFVARNRELRSEILKAGERVREDRLLDEDVRRFEFYDRRLPGDIHNASAFDAWRRRAERRDPAILEMTAADFGEPGGRGVEKRDYPDSIEIGGLEVRLSYRHEPGHPEDGVTVHIPLELLGRFDPARFEWLVPGLLAGKCEALVRALPKRIRTRLMPIRETAAGAAEHLGPQQGGLFDALAGYLTTVAGLEIRARDFRLDLLEDHHSIRFEIIDASGTSVDSGRNYRQLLARHHSESRTAFETAAAASSNDEEAQRLSAIEGRRAWDFGSVPSEILLHRAEGALTAFPALHDDGDAISIRITDDARTAHGMHERGVRRLLAIANRDALAHHLDHLPDAHVHRERFSAIAPSHTFLESLGDLALQVILQAEHGLETVRDAPAFEAVDELIHQRLWPGLERSIELVVPILEQASRLRTTLEAPSPSAWAGVLTEERSHLDRLLTKSTLTTTPVSAIERLPVYLSTGMRRIDRLRGDGLARDAARGEEFAGWWRLYDARRGELATLGRSDPRLERFRWTLEDYRVQLHAPELGRARRVGVADLKSAWSAVVG